MSVKINMEYMLHDELLPKLNKCLVMIGNWTPQVRLGVVKSMITSKLKKSKVLNLLVDIFATSSTNIKATIIVH
jgi:hypothetical protein